MCLTLVAGAASAEATGKVYYLNFKPEADEAWQALAKTYTEQTGVPVTVVTAASGTYSETLTAEMDKGDAAPTLFSAAPRPAWIPGPITSCPCRTPTSTKS